ncbi:MAG: PAS domain-containing sensor histidine kinase [bacterium]|nr:PAS domain-containing sensor histidine kinase [bacterium]
MESLQKDCQALSFVQEDNGKTCDDFIAEVIKTGQGVKMANHTLLITRDGQKIPVADSAAPIKNDQGNIIGCVLVFRDMTREWEIDKSKSEFVSLASHQLRTPLTGIEWTIDLFIKKEKLTEQGKKYLQDIRFSSSRLSALIKLLLNVSRIESGKISIAPESLELVELIKKYIRECPIYYEKRKISLIFIKHPEKCIVTTDKNLFQYILQNLVSNAIDYTPPGGKVEILLEDKQDTILLQVRDTGIGIPKEEQSHIFEKFVRASNAITTKPDGTGLGLYIVQETVKFLGGKIWFESQEGKGPPAGRQGSTFFVELPLVAQAHPGEKALVLENK